MSRPSAPAPRGDVGGTWGASRVWSSQSSRGYGLWGGGFSAPQLHQPVSDTRCKRAEGGGEREQRTNSRSNGEGRGRKRRWWGGEKGCPPHGWRIALYPPSFPPFHTPTTEAASHQDIYEHTHKWEAEGRQKKKTHTNNHPTLFCSFSFFKEQMCCGLQTEKDTPLLLANLG